MAAFTVVVMDRGAPGGGAVLDHCTKDARISVIGVARDGQSAIELIRALRPDAALLDVDVSDAGGMALAEAIGAAGHALVLTTEHRDHAVRAFELGAVDFLLKPVTSSRLSATIGRLADALERRCHRTADSDELWLPRAAGMVRVDLERIERVEADRDYVRLIAGPDSFLLRATMGEIERRLPSTRFIRIHRSTIVALEQVRACRHVRNGAWEALGPEGRAHPIGRRYLPAVRERLGLPACPPAAMTRHSGGHLRRPAASSAPRLTSAAALT